ncbi:MAG: hypothetical protein HC784_04355 [Hydrococcus sp. CSU_1_8]|nr:hypothetical protein [Hydrococcus sp. CSU_1_8]
MGGSLRNFQQFSFSPYWQFKASPWLPFVLNLVSTPVSREADVDPDRDAYINDNFFSPRNRALRATMVRKVILWLLWIGFIFYILFLAPPIHWQATLTLLKIL